MRRKINDKELHFFYAKVGKAIWHLQHVENNIANFILIKGLAKELDSLSESEANKHIKRLKKLTLGQLIGETEKHEIMSEELLFRVKEFNKERKWIVHNSAHESGHELYTDEGREYVFNKISSFIDEAITINKAVENELIHYSVNKGQSLEKIEKMATDHVNKLKGRV